MDSVNCGMAPEGIADGGNGYAMTIHDMAKFGLLYLNGGRWEGEQLVPAQWVKDSTRAQAKRSSGSSYGYQWWIRSFGGHPAYVAQGHWGQFIIVVPDLELVIAYTSYNEGNDSSIYWKYVGILLERQNNRKEHSCYEQIDVGSIFFGRRQKKVGQRYGR